MKLLYLCQTAPEFETLKRMLLLGDELVFMDRPSIVFGNWGTVGRESELRHIRSSPTVPHNVVLPPGGQLAELYKKYNEADLANSAFVKTVYEGLTDDADFASKLIHPNSDYGGGVRGAKAIEMLRGDPSLGSELFKLDESGFPGDLTSRDGLRTLLRMQVTEASLQITQGLLVANETNACPVADDQTYAKLLALRTKALPAGGAIEAAAPMLGVEICRAVIPDFVLRRIATGDILNYRAKTKDVYAAWDIELQKITAQLTDADTVPDKEQVRRYIFKELQPRVQEYKNEMASARDAMFADVMKGVITKDAPALIVANLAGMNWLGALSTFAAVAAGVAAPAVIDYVKSRATIQRKHPISYLLRLTDE